MIDVRNVVKNYGSAPALAGVSFNIGSGQVVGLLGPNGAGKSTIMNIMTGFLPPSSGQVLIDGIDIWEQPIPAKRRIGYLPENPPLYNDMRVEEYLGFCADLRQLENKSERIEFVVDRLGLSEVAHKRNSHLSKGFRQRVGIAQAIIHNPDLLILDEPTIGLDPMQMIEIRDLITELKTDHTILLSTHILSEVERTCDSVIIIHKGDIIAKEGIGKLSQWKGKKRVHFTIKQAPTESQMNQLNTKYGQKVKVDGLKVSFDVASEDENTQLSQSMIEIFGGISSMQVDEHSLEDIFVEMTSGEQHERH